MATHWQLGEDDQKLRELVARATNEGPQQIEEEGRGVAVVISLAEFERLRQREGSLVEFFRRSPLVGSELDLTREPDTGEGRDIELPDLTLASSRSSFASSLTRTSSLGSRGWMKTSCS